MMHHHGIRVEGHSLGLEVAQHEVLENEDFVEVAAAAGLEEGLQQLNDTQLASLFKDLVQQVRRQLLEGQ